MNIVKNKLLFGILILVMIFSVNLIHAAPPTQTNVNLNIGIQIQTSGIETIRQNTNHSFGFHVFNITTQLALDPTTTNCSFHLYNKTGQHQFINDLIDFDDGDYKITLLGTNFSDLGLYNYYIYCNNSDIGGFARENFEVTPTGQALDEPQGTIVLGIIILLIFLSGIFFYLGKESKYLPAKIFLISMGVLFLMVTLGVSVIIIKELLIIGSIFTTTFVNLYRLMLILISAGGIGLIVYIIHMAVRQFFSHRGLLDNEFHK